MKGIRIISNPAPCYYLVVLVGQNLFCSISGRPNPFVAFLFDCGVPSVASAAPFYVTIEPVLESYQGRPDK